MIQPWQSPQGLPSALMCTIDIRVSELRFRCQTNSSNWAPQWRFSKRFFEKA